MGFEEDIKAGFKCDHCDKIFGIASNRYYLDLPVAKNILQTFTGIVMREECMKGKVLIKV